MQIAQPPTPADEPEMMTWLDHLIELRNRLLKASIAVLIGLIVGFFVVQYNNYALINYIIAEFAGPGGLQAIAVTENFTNTIQISLGIGIALAMPVIVYQLLAFVVPGLTTRERRIIYTVLPFITLLFAVGLLFGWFVTLPAAFQFLLGFGPDSIRIIPTFDLFSSFFVRLMLINGVIFELPVVVYALIWLGVVDRKTLAKYRRYAILVITIVAAIVTPTPDPINLALVAIPMYLLYELGLLLALLAPRKHTVVAGS
jgi:sec-independent protein translocase protein TatC